MRANLVAVPDSGLHDLPPRWDGLDVTWSGWRATTAHICPPLREACTSCGCLEWPTVNIGHINLGLNRRGRQTFRVLTAFRCVECGADHVLDDKGVMWDLDLTDYGDAGSVAPRPPEDT